MDAKRVAVALHRHASRSDCDDLFLCRLRAPECLNAANVFSAKFLSVAIFDAIGGQSDMRKM
jgi:hypothetical protein